MHSFFFNLSYENFFNNAKKKVKYLVVVFFLSTFEALFLLNISALIFFINKPKKHRHVIPEV